MKQAGGLFFNFMVLQGLFFSFDKEIKGVKPEKNKNLAKDLKEKIERNWSLYYDTPEENTQGRNKLLKQIEELYEEVDMFSGKDFYITITTFWGTRLELFSTLQKNNHIAEFYTKEGIEYFENILKREKHKDKKASLRKLLKTLKRLETGLKTGFLPEKKMDEYDIMYSLIGTRLIINTSS